MVYCSGGRPDYLDEPVDLLGQSPIAIQVRLELMKKQGEALISITPRSDAKRLITSAGLHHCMLLRAQRHLWVWVARL